MGSSIAAYPNPKPIYEPSKCDFANAELAKEKTKSEVVIIFFIKEKFVKKSQHLKI